MQITVGITCYNNGDNISTVLSNVAHQALADGDSIIEVLVVASGCTDDTVERVQAFAADERRTRLIVEDKRMGKPSAINKLTSQMRGDALLLLSGDIRIPQNDFVANMVKIMGGPVAVVSCRPLPANCPHAPSGYVSGSMWGLHDKTLSAQTKNHLFGHAGEAFAIKREALEPVPSDIINDDAYLVLRAQQKGFKVSYARDLIIRNRSPEGIGEMIRQRARIIRGHSQLGEVLGVQPDVLDMLLFRRPLVALGIVKTEVREEIGKGIFRPDYFLLLLIMEAVAHGVAKIGSLDNRWTPAASAKWLR
jgi:cellulose synthase/poly-beta-1,6-N-acetylglucosamine synthase-like glycosyltransferase